MHIDWVKMSLSQIPHKNTWMCRWPRDLLKLPSKAKRPKVKPPHCGLGIRLLERTFEGRLIIVASKPHTSLFTVASPMSNGDEEKIYAMNGHIQAPPSHVVHQQQNILLQARGVKANDKPGSRAQVPV